MRKSTRFDLPAKPYPDFPLFPHQTGRWAKKVRGKMHFFGRWATTKAGAIIPVESVEASAAAALERFNREWPYLSQGRTPPTPGTENGCNVGALCNAFLKAQKRKLDSREITERTFAEYHSTTDLIVGNLSKQRPVVDLEPLDFECLRSVLAQKYGPVRLGNSVQRIRTVFKYGLDVGLVQQPARFGPNFKKPSKSVLRRHRAQRGQKLFTAVEIRAMLDNATVPMRAMIYLAINCGFGNGDCGNLPHTAISGAWINFPRPKTGIARRCPLWPETLKALRAFQKTRPAPKDAAHSDRVFITKYGKPWLNRDGLPYAISIETGKLLSKCGVARDGTGFYALRHTFRTIADATRDFPAIRLIMGHGDDSIDDIYREHIDDARLLAVTNHVREWLFPKASDNTAKAGETRRAKPKRGTK